MAIVCTDSGALALTIRERNMDETKEQVLSLIDQVIERYQQAIEVIESASPQPSPQSILELFLARDALEQQRQQWVSLSGSYSITIVELDKRLQALAAVITQTTDLESFRQSWQPPESAWWWFLQPPPKTVNRFDRFDWVWNGLTVGCLVFASSFATQTAKAFSTEGFDLLGTLSTIGQGAGLVLVTRGAVTDRGKQEIEHILQSLKIPPQFYAEATFGFSAFLLAATYGVHSSLPAVGGFYYNLGQKLMAKGNTVEALSKYRRALNFTPSNSALFVALGKVSEEMGNLQDAQTYYEKGRSLNNAKAINGLGRVILLQAIEKSGWTKKIDEAAARKAEFLFEMADRVNDEVIPKSDRETEFYHQLKSEIFTHVGILFLKRINLDDLAKFRSDRSGNAKKEFQQAQFFFELAASKFNYAADIEANLKTKTPGKGSVQCYQKLVDFLLAAINYQNGQNFQKQIEQTVDCIGMVEDLNLYDETLIMRMLDSDLGLPDEAYQ
jgi:tetratricopeptide (TPR) repeat protein